jgi:hypothetical protein
VTRAYCLLVAVVPEDEQDAMRFSEGALHVKVCTQIYGEPMDCAAMLQNMAADIQTSIKEEIMKGSGENAS